MAELPNPDFITRCFSEEGEATDFIAHHIAPEKLMAFWDEGDRLWKVTTKANFEVGQYWNGKPEEVMPDGS